MPTYDEIRSATTESSYDSGGGRWDSERFTRERDERMYRAAGPAPPVRERSRSRPRPFPQAPSSERRPRYDDRFERRVVDEEVYSGPRRSRDYRFVEEDDFYENRGSGPLVPHPRREREREREAEEAPFRPPRLVRRQSSLDTFDRLPARRVERAPPIRGMYLQRAPAPAPPPPPSSSHRRPSVGARYVDEEEYEEIDIAEPDFYGDEEFRHFREREQRRRGPVPVREEIVKEKIVEKDRTYPRKGKTKMPKRLVLARAVQQLGYPYIEEDKTIIIQKALSKELIDEVVTLSRELRRRSDTAFVRRYESPPPSREFVERVVVRSPSPVRTERLVIEQSPPRAERFVVEASPPRAERFVVEASSPPRTNRFVVEASPARSERLYVEASPARYRSPSRVRAGRYLDRPEIVETRPRSVSVNFPRARSPVIVERRGGDESGAVVMVQRPRRSDYDVSEEIRMLEDEKRMLQIERRPLHDDSVDIITDKVVRRADGEVDESIEVRKDKRPGDSRIIRAMMATLT